jgi:hypothetical protein
MWLGEKASGVYSVSLSRAMIQSYPFMFSYVRICIHILSEKNSNILQSESYVSASYILHLSSLRLHIECRRPGIQAPSRATTRGSAPINFGNDAHHHRGKGQLKQG